MIPAIGYSDRAGNYGNEDLQLNIWIPETPKSFIQQSGSVAVLGTFAATTAMSLTSAGLFIKNLVFLTKLGMVFDGWFSVFRFEC